jgi:hypothetical protein
VKITWNELTQEQRELLQIMKREHGRIQRADLTLRTFTGAGHRKIDTDTIKVLLESNFIQYNKGYDCYELPTPYCE